MNQIKKKIKEIAWFPAGFYHALNIAYNNIVRFYNRTNFGYIGKNTILEYPITITNPKNVYLSEHTKIRRGLFIINDTGKFVLKKYSAIAINCTIITGNHTPTVGIPHIILGSSHINDKETDIIVEEEVWIGANCTLLSNTHIGRGAIIGACSLVNKEIPPYAVAVGSPAKIIASVFTIEEIIAHEKQIYTETERFSYEYLSQLFEKYFKDKKSIGVSQISAEDELKIDMKKKIMGIDY